MRIETVTESHREHFAIVGKNDLPLGQIEVQGLAFLRFLTDSKVSVPQRFDAVPHQRRGLVVRVAISGGLGLLIGQRSGGLHQAAGKPVAYFAARRVQLNFERNTGPIDAFVQGTQIARQAVRQHRNYAIREVRRVPALAGLTVQRGVWADIMGNICDSDPNDMATFVRRIRVGQGADRVVVVAGI